MARLEQTQYHGAIAPQCALRQLLLWIVCNVFVPLSGHKLRLIGPQTATVAKMFWEIVRQAEIVW